jgi:predicted CoA-binding protein
MSRDTSGEACPMPSRTPGSEFDAIGHMLKGKRIAIVGMSDDPDRPSHGVGGYLITHGYDVVPVNPNHQEIMHRKCYAKLSDVPGPIDVVNVFRRPQFCAEVTRDAIAAGAKGVWLQAGIQNSEARKMATEAGIEFIEDRCIMVEHMSRRSR